MKCTSSMGLIKRAIPFFATFAFALLITSFFVDISRPGFGRGRHARKFQEMQRLRIENEQLRFENEQLKMNGPNSMRLDHLEDTVPRIAFDPPTPPVAPVAPHAHK